MDQTPEYGIVTEPPPPDAGEHGNRLLAALSPSARTLLDLRSRHVPAGTALWEAGQPIDRVYFPLSGMISLLIPTEGGRGVEVGCVGVEGAADLRNAIQGTEMPTRGIVQVGGGFASAPAQSFAAAARQDEDIAALSMLAQDWMLLQAQHLATCNAVHAADARLCRWLSTTFDRLGSDVIPVTQESIAEMLGIRRTTVTLLAQKLQNDGVISYSRARITLRNPHALRAAACECCDAISRRNWPSSRMARRTDGGSPLQASVG